MTTPRLIRLMSDDDPPKRAVQRAGYWADYHAKRKIEPEYRQRKIEAMRLYRRKKKRVIRMTLRSRILTFLHEAPATTEDIARHIGRTKDQTLDHLWDMRLQDRVKSELYLPREGKTGRRRILWEIA